MTIWPTRSRSVSVPSVLSTHRRWVGERDAPGRRPPATTGAAAGLVDGAGTTTAPHAAAVTYEAARSSGNRRCLIPEYTTALGRRSLDWIRAPRELRIRHTVSSENMEPVVARTF